MMGLSLSRRARIALIAILLGAMLVLFPMRLALGILSLDRYGISARGVQGSIWWGRIEQLTVGDVPVGSVRAGLSPIQLLVGRARIDIWRKAGLPDDIAGAFSVGFGRVGIDDATGSLPLGAAMAPLPVSGIDLSDVSLRFAHGACAHAEGQVKLRLTNQIAGLNLSQGMSGAARCSGADLLVPLVSQSGMEKMNLRLTADGHYMLEMLVATTDPALAAALGSAGFAQAGDSFALRIDGAL